MNKRQKSVLNSLSIYIVHVVTLVAGMKPGLTEDRVDLFFGLVRCVKSNSDLESGETKPKFIRYSNLCYYYQVSRHTTKHYDELCLSE